MQTKDKKNTAATGQRIHGSSQDKHASGAPRIPRTGKQIAALLCVGLLAALYIFTLVAAFLDFPHSDRLFAGCLVATVGLPILLWIYIWLYQKVKERREGGEK